MGRNMTSRINFFGTACILLITFAGASLSQSETCRVPSSSRLGAKKDSWYIEIQTWKKSRYNAASKEVQKKYDRIHKLLMYHELGHQKIVEDLLKQYNGKLQKLTANSVGALTKKVTDLTKEFDKVLKQSNDAYEKKTKQGRKQPDKKPKTARKIAIKEKPVENWDFTKSYHGWHHFQLDGLNFEPQCN